MLKPIDKAGLAFIQSWEGLHDGDKRTPQLEPERDPVGIYTIGWGYALFQNGKPVTDKTTAYGMWRALYPNGMTRADADALLHQVINSWSAKLDALVKVSLNQNQSNAIRSFTYNVGIGVQDGRKGDFADSTLLKLLNRGDFQGAAAQFASWVYGGGRKIKGLVNRRAAEAALFLKD